MTKLIRDGYTRIISGNKLTFSEDLEYSAKLLADKLIEETTELADSNFKDIDEYADVLEVLEALMNFHGISYDDVLSAKQEKFDKLQGFDNLLILEC